VRIEGEVGGPDVARRFVERGTIQEDAAKNGAFGVWTGGQGVCLN
jgi:hypothetical protein